MMEGENLSIEEFHKHLKSWEEHEIQILKYEKSDSNEIRLQLEKVQFTKNNQKVDDYLAKYTLQLKGEGEIRTQNDDFVPLPQSAFEIPLEDDSTFSLKDKSITIRNERGKYILQRITP